MRLVQGDEEVPAQVQLTARWPDGSVKWLLVTFLASAPAVGQAEYQLKCGPTVQRAPVTGGLSISQSADGMRIDTGALTLRVDPQGRVTDVSDSEGRRFAENAQALTVAEDAQGNTFLPGDGTLEIEEAGPIRAVIKTVSPLREANGSSYGKGFSMYYRVGPRVLADLEAAGLGLQ